MSQKSSTKIINAIYPEGPKRQNATNNTDVYHIDDI